MIYVLSYGISFIPNVNPIFFIVFSAGFMWGTIPGILTGMIGMGLWTFFNPFGPAQLPVMAAQIVGTALSGSIGALSYNLLKSNSNKLIKIVYLAIASIICTLLFYIPVNFIDAWLIQPFMARFITGMTWSVISLVSNILIFPVLFIALESFYIKERERVR
jgi:uncharacterized membrane protein